MGNRCIGCQSLIDDSEKVCPFCGFSESDDHSDAMYMRPGTLLADRYVIGNTLGIGGFGITYRAWDRNLQQKVAIKEYLPSEFSTRIPGHTHITIFSHEKSEQFYSGMTKFIEEAKNLAKFHNVSGIVKIYDAFEANLTAYIVMELLEGETLAKRLAREKTLPSEEALRITHAVLNALNAVHKGGVLHRDIAPDNIFLTESGQIKLIDFGAARYATTSHSRSITVIIKPGYSPEEQYRSRGDQGPHTDVYAVGATLYRMLTGVVPPDALERRASIEARKKDPLVPLAGSASMSEGVIAKTTTAVASFFRKVTAALITPIKKLSRWAADKLMPEARHADDAEEPAAPTFRERICGVLRSVEKWATKRCDQLNVGYAISKSQATAVMNALNIQIEDRTPDGEAFLEELSLDRPVERRASRINSTDYLGLTRVRIVTVVSVLLCASMLLAAVAGLFTPKEDYSIVIPEDMTRVPQVINTDIALAGQALDDAVLIYQITGNEYSDVIPENMLLNQSIAGGSVVTKNTVVELVMSVGKMTNTVPNVIGYPSETASRILQETPFAVAIEEQTSASVAQGCVIAQNIPAGNDFPINETIIIYVSSGYEAGTESAAGEVVLPDLTDVSLAQAMETAQAQGFRISVSAKEYSNEYPEDRVMTQEPAAGAAVPAGSTVNLTVSLGEERVKVPDVVYLTEEDLIQVAEEKGLTLSVEREYSKTVMKGLVIRQLTAAWSWAHPGDELKVVISDGLPPFDMPDLSGMTEEEARQALLDAELAVDVAYAKSGEVPEGYVLKQSVAAGEPVTAGMAITVTISSGLKLIEVPDVSGQDAEKAEKTLRDLGFEVEINRVYSDDVAAGLVISQTPAAGTTHAEETVIYLNVSRGRKPVETTTTTTKTGKPSEKTKPAAKPPAKPEKPATPPPTPPPTTTTTTTTRAYTTTRPTLD